MSTPFERTDEDLPETLRDGMFPAIDRSEWGSVVAAPGSYDSVFLIRGFRDVSCCIPASTFLQSKIILALKHFSF